MSEQRQIDLLSSAPQELVLPGGMTVAQQIVLAFQSNPAAGTAKVEVMEAGSSRWIALTKAAALPLASSPHVIRSSGWISRVRVTLTGASGGSGGMLWAQELQSPAGLYEGAAAITTQPYSEANVKNGQQFYLRAAWPKGGEIPAGQTRKVWISTGASPIIVKLRLIEFDAEELRVDLFEGPTGVTGGTVITPRNYNRINPAATDLQAKKNVTTTTDGTAFDPDDPEFLFGASNSPQRTPGSIPQGRERILKPNTQYIAAITNTGASIARVQYFLDYYQGQPDLPL